MLSRSTTLPKSLPVFLLHHRRTVSTIPNGLDLSFHLTKPKPKKTPKKPISITESPLIILHGLLGSKRNWDSVAKYFAREGSRAVYSLDLRNHGQSPRSKTMTYEAMAADVHRFIHTKELKNPVVLGHSMGGKVAMTLALTQPTCVGKLIVADITPREVSLEPQFTTYINALKAVDAAKVQTYPEAENIVKQWETNPWICHYILSNVDRKSGEPVRCTLPLDTLSDNLHNMNSFPFSPSNEENVKFDRPTLLVQGSKSNYVDKSGVDGMRKFFSHMVVTAFNTGHWVHGEEPVQFNTLVTSFSKVKDATAGGFWS